MKKLALPGPLVISPVASHILDAMRAIAAFAVLFSHIRPLFFVDYAQVENHNFFIRLFYLLTGLGHESVVIFFVLSGLLVGMSVLRTHQRDAWSWIDYLLQRLTRLWAVLIPALLLTLMWDTLGIRWFGLQSVYAGLPSDQFILGFSTAQRLTWPLFLGNVFFLQTIACPTFGSNGPLWSLANEFWYYLAFPCGLRLLVAPSLPSRVLHGAAFLAIVALVGREIDQLFFIWILGVAVMFLPSLWKKFRPISPGWCLVSLLFLAASLAGSAARNSLFFIFLIGLSCAAVVYSVFRLPQSNPTLQTAATAPEQLSLSLLKRLADFSYSLYLLHLPPLVFIHGYLIHRGLSKWQPTPVTLFYGAMLTAVILIYAYFISRLTEAHTDQIRRRIKKTLFSPVPKPVLS